MFFTFKFNLTGFVFVLRKSCIVSQQRLDLKYYNSNLWCQNAAIKILYSLDDDILNWFSFYVIKTDFFQL